MQTAGHPPLTAERVIALLLSRGLLSERLLVEGDVRVEETPGRNHNFRVEVTGGPGYFLKQAPSEDTEDSPLEIEAELYRRVLEEQAWSPLRPMVPAFRLYEAQRAVLVTELARELTGVAGLGDGHSMLGLGRVSGPLARALAVCHDMRPGSGAPDLDFLPREAPGILGITRPHPGVLQYLSPAQLQVIRMIQERPAITAAFDEIRVGWSATCLVHGDVKWPNVLARVDAPSGAPAGVVLFDWELARLGDPAWDVGSVLHGYLTYAVLSAAVPDNACPREAAESIGATLPAFHGELRTFWHTYVESVSASGEGRRPSLGQAIACCAARLVQSGYEWSQEETAVPGRAAAILQLGINMLGRADEAREVVLGGLTEH
jgi:Predicted choline kinase involved in LPS biosynthesis